VINDLGQAEDYTNANLAELLLGQSLHIYNLTFPHSISVDNCTKEYGSKLLTNTGNYTTETTVWSRMEAFNNGTRFSYDLGFQNLSY
jgi:hypothetical protein